MNTPLSFQQALTYINEGLNQKVTGKSGMVTLKNTSQEDSLIFQAEDGGARVSLFAPFLRGPEELELQKVLNLHFLHLNADLDALGSLRIIFNADTNQYSLCDGALAAESVGDFVDYVQAVLITAHNLHREITEVLSEAVQQSGAEIAIDNSQYLKA